MDNYISIYNEVDKQIMQVAEDALNSKIDRVQEIIAFAKQANIKHIGVANCICFEKQAEVLEKHLQEEGFSVSRVNCKLGKVPFDTLIAGYKGVMCNPAGQAETLKENNTELNIVMGLCVGHDMVFNLHSNVPTTTLIVKDRKLKHNPLEHFVNT